MDINDFFSKYRNHPVLFIGTGFSLRYLKNSYTWDGLLKKIIFELYGNNEKYLDIKSNCEERGKYKYDRIASIIEKEFNEKLINDRNGKFKKINDIFYQKMDNEENLSRFKIYISELLRDNELKEDKTEEISYLKRARKNIGSIITTNYDSFIEEIFEFTPLIGNDILLSNPYGSVYKIHGCVKDPLKIIISSEDYKSFNERYELIRAQLLSLFIHNPIIFMGYNIGDDNIKSILKTIFTYVALNTKESEKIRENFLLVEYEENSNNKDVVEHDIEIEGFSTIRINKLKTDDFKSIYKSLSDLHLPISAMDIRKVQNVVHEIYSGGKIEVHFTENIDSLKNGDKIIAIGSSKTITYKYHTVSEMIQKYFSIIEESNIGIISLIEKHKIQGNQFFPIFGFTLINSNLKNLKELKIQQINNLRDNIKRIKEKNKRCIHTKIDDILEDNTIAESYKYDMILLALYNDQLDLREVEDYLKGYNYEERKTTNYRKLLCMYDFKKYRNLSKEEDLINIELE